MKVLFLDIDGVCNNASTMERHRSFIGIKPELADLVRHIVAATRCKVVLSSTWRLDADSRNAVRQQVCPFIDITPNLHGERRGYEVKDWLIAHPEVTRYAILDDNSDFLAGQHLFQTTWKKGLTPSIAEQVIMHLNSVD